jgi:UDP-glucose 4-epimerase
VEHPELYERNNVEATTSLATAMERVGLTRIVYASTGSVYGERACDAFVETDPTAPINPYASTKLGGEEVLGEFAGRTSASVACMRFFNVVGAHPSAHLGEFGDESTNLLPILMDTLNGKRESVTIFGTDWDTVDGTCIRDYVHVCDIASALVAALVHIDSITGRRQFNVGTGIGTSVRALINAVQDAAKAPINALDGPRREGDPGVSVAGVSRIQSELGWKADHDLQSMVNTALAWNAKRNMITT